MLREQPSLSAWGRPAGWVPRPQVGRRAWLADTVEGLVRSHDPRRGLRTRPDHHLSQMKLGKTQGSSPVSCPTKPLVSYRSNRQLSGWNPPPLVIRAVGAHWEIWANGRRGVIVSLITLSPVRLFL